MITIFKKTKRNILNVIRFYIDHLRFDQFLRKNTNMISVKNDKIFCVVVMPWIGAAVPWYAILLKILLEQKNQNVFFLLDDMVFGDNKFFYKIQIILIKKILNKYNFEYKILSSYSDFKDIDLVLIDKISSLNSIHFTKGETNMELRSQYEIKIKKQLMDAFRKYATFLKASKFNTIIAPGGIWGSSAIIVNLARDCVVTYDGAPGHLLFSINGVAAQLSDIDISFKNIFLSQKDRDFAIIQGQRQLYKRQSGSGFNAFFSDNKSKLDVKDYYLMLLNSVWDSAALGIHGVYSEMIDWIFDSIDWVLKYTERDIIVRQHPAERYEHINNSDSYDIKIRQKFGNNKRIVFVKAQDDTNTYTLIQNSCCILGFSSTSVIEAVCMKKPAIIVSKAYYAKLNVVYVANSINHYHDLLDKANNCKLEISLEMQERAFVVNYITQVCNWYATDITPHKEDFLKWYKRDMESIGDEYDMVIQSFIKNIPISLLQHKEKLNETNN